MELLCRLLVVLGLDRIRPKHVLRVLDQALLSVLDLIGVNVKLLSQLRQCRCALTPHRCQRCLRLEGRGMIMSLSSSHLPLLLFRDSSFRRFHLRETNPCPVDGVHLSHPHGNQDTASRLHQKPPHPIRCGGFAFSAPLSYGKALRALQRGGPQRLDRDRDLISEIFCLSMLDREGAEDDPKKATQSFIGL